MNHQMCQNRWPDPWADAKADDSSDLDRVKQEEALEATSESAQLTADDIRNLMRSDSQFN